MAVRLLRRPAHQVHPLRVHQQMVLAAIVELSTTSSVTALFSTPSWLSVGRRVCRLHEARRVQARASTVEAQEEKGSEARAAAARAEKGPLFSSILTLMDGFLLEPRPQAGRPRNRRPPPWRKCQRNGPEDGEVDFATSWRGTFHRLRTLRGREREIRRRRSWKRFSRSMSTPRFPISSQRTSSLL